MLARVVFSFLFCLLLISHATASTVPHSWNYKVYYGDLDGDGVEDLVFVPIKRYAPIAVPMFFVFDVNRNKPVKFMRGKDDGTFIAPQHWGGEFSKDGFALVDPIFADFDGNGAYDVFIQGLHGAMASMLLSVNADGSLSIRQQLFEVEGQALNKNSATLALGYANGRAYLIVNSADIMALGTALTFSELKPRTIPSLPSVNPQPQILGSNQYGIDIQSHGAANINVPVLVPPGINGHQPNLSFSYYSGGGNGVMGVGWSLGGVPAISRCAKTVAHDGVSMSRVQFSNEDRLCMGGQRLVSTDGNALSDTQYWQAGNEFSLANDPTTRVSSHQDSQQNLYFVAKTKQGKSLVFGDTSNSRFTPPNTGAVSTWMLSSAQDITLVNGSSYQLFYEKDELRGTYYLSELVYPGVRIDMAYKEGRKDAVRQYSSKSYREERRFLHKVNVWQQSSAGEELYRQYRLAYHYAPQTRLLRLGKIYECGVTQCADPYLVSWSDLERYNTTETEMPGGEIKSPSSFLSTLSLSWPGTGSKLLTHYYSSTESRLQVVDLLSERVSTMGLGDKYRSMVAGDFNNSGYPELLALAPIGSDGKGVWRIAPLMDDPGNPGGIDIGSHQDVAQYQYSPSKAALFADPNMALSPMMADINRNGKLDLIMPTDDGWRILENVTPAKSTSFSFIDRGLISDRPIDEYKYGMVINLDGGKKQHVVWRKEASWAASAVGMNFQSQPYSTGIQLPPTNTIFMDINGDGLYDIADASSGTFRFQLNLGGDGFSPVYDTGIPSDKYMVSLSGTSGTSSGTRVTEERHYIKVMDYNKNGLHDLLVRKPDSASWHVLLSNGEGFDDPVNTGLRISNNNSGQFSHIFTKITDLDGDGNPEIVQYDTVYRSSRYEHKVSYFQPVNNETPSTSDVVGGLGGLANEDIDDGVAFRPNLVTAFTDQYGGRSLFAYAPLSQYRVYTNVGFDERTWLDFIFDDGELNELGEDDVELTAPMPAVIAMLQPGGGMGILHLFGYDTPYYSASGRGMLGVRARAQARIDLGLFANMESLAEGAPNLHDEEGNLNGEALRAFLEPFFGAAGTILTWDVDVEAYSTTPGLNGRVAMARSYRGDWTVAESLNFYDYLQSLSEISDSQVLANTLMTNILGERVLESSNNWSVVKRYGANLARLLGQTVYRFVPETGEPLSKEVVSQTHDNWGNVTSRSASLALLSGQNQFRHRTETYQLEYDLSQWLLGFVTQSDVVTETPEGVDSQTTLISRFAGTRAPASITELAGTDVELQTHYHYDANGNLRQETVTDPATSQSRSIHYSNFAYGRHPQTVTNSAGHTTHRQVRDVAGRVSQQSRIDGVTTYYQRDQFGRTVTEQTPTLVGTMSSQITLKRGRSNCSTCAGYTVSTSGGGQPAAVTEYDAVGLPVMERVQLLNGSYSTTRKRYDGKGNVIAQTQPNSDSVKRFNYDKMGRQVFVSRPDGYHRTVAWSTSASTGNSTAIVIEEDRSSFAGSASPHKTSVHVQDFLGRTTSITDPQGTVIATDYNAMGLPASRTLQSTDGKTANYSFSYDAAGRRQVLTDPNIGQTVNNYNAFGDLLTVTDNAGRLTSNQYDVLGRLQSRIEDANGAEPVESRWYYDQQPSGIAAISEGGQPCGDGRLCAVTQSQGGELNYVQHNQYHENGLPKKEHRHFAGRSFTLAYDYDSSNRLTSVTYPNGVIERQAFNAWNHLFQRGYCLNDNDCPGNGYVGTLIQQVNAWNAPTEIGYGNQLVSQFNYDASGTRVTGIRTGHGYEVQALAYEYDGLGNLVSRANSRAIPGESSLNVTEQFSYDTLGRLSTINGDNLYSYDSFGNINTKPGLGGELVYGDSQRPHRVTARTENGNTQQTFSYDQVGNLTSDGELTVSYTPFNKPEVLSKGDLTKTFAYGPDHQRYQQVTSRTDGTRIEVLYLAGGSYRETRLVKPDGTTQVREDVSVAGAVQVRKSYALTNGEAGTKTTRIQYLHQDAQGSVDAITDHDGNLMSPYSYAPFGSRRSPEWINQLPLPEKTLEALFERLQDDGYTEHEMLDDFGLIHMGGRLYHPGLGRFLSPDPFVQTPENTQNYNRYSYVLNNPMKYVDPTGYMYSLPDNVMRDHFVPAPPQVWNDQMLNMNQWVNHDPNYQSIVISVNGGGGNGGSGSGSYNYVNPNRTVDFVGLIQGGSGSSSSDAGASGVTSNNENVTVKIGGGSSELPDRGAYMFACNGCDMPSIDYRTYFSPTEKGRGVNYYGPEPEWNISDLLGIPLDVPIAGVRIPLPNGDSVRPAAGSIYKGYRDWYQYEKRVIVYEEFYTSTGGKTGYSYQEGYRYEVLDNGAVAREHALILCSLGGSKCGPFLTWGVPGDMMDRRIDE